MRRTSSVLAGAAVVVLAGGITAAASTLVGGDVPSVEVEPVADPDPEPDPEPVVVPELPASVDWMAPEPDPVYSRTVEVEPDEDVAVEDEPSGPSDGAPASSEPAADTEPADATTHEEESDVTDAPTPEPEPEPEVEQPAGNENYEPAPPDEEQDP